MRHASCSSVWPAAWRTGRQQLDEGILFFTLAHPTYRKAQASASFAALTSQVTESLHASELEDCGIRLGLYVTHLGSRDGPYTTRRSRVRQRDRRARRAARVAGVIVLADTALDRQSRLFEWCFVLAPGTCAKTAPTLPVLGFLGAVFFGFLASRPDRFCPFAIVTSHND